MYFHGLFGVCLQEMALSRRLAQMLAFVLLFVVDDPTISFCITLFATLLGFSMTLRKAYQLPHEENAQAFFLNAIKFLPAIFAVNTLSFLTIAYPITALLANASVVAVILARKNIVTR
jgi:hypothetical protein